VKKRSTHDRNCLHPALWASIVAAGATALAALLVTVTDASAQAGRGVESTLLVEGYRNAAEASVSTRAMKYLPFDVPEGVTRITVHREYDHGPDPTRKNTVDFGLWDNRGTGKGFRGWQGGSPGDFVITGDAATCSPHAVPGPLAAGRWYIAQYYLVSAPAGLGYKYTVTFSFDGPKPPRSFPAPPRYAPGVVRKGAGWYAGNLHAHSLHSDGGRTLEAMIGRCADAGFDFVASTEHNSPTAHFRFAEVSRAHPGVLLLYGDEFTSPGGHANIIGMTPGRWFDFRIDPGDGKLPGVVAEAHRQGAVFMANHPYAPCTSCTWRYPEGEWASADAVEVWNGKWTPDDRAAVDLWDRQLKAGRRLWAYGGTDYHRGEDALVPTALVYADELATPAVLNGLRRGRVLLSESPKGPRVYLTVGDGRTLPGDTVTVSSNAADAEIQAQIVGAGGEGVTLRLVWADGEARLPVPADGATLRQRIPLPVGQRTAYVRAELLRAEEGGEQMVVLTNPVFFARRGGGK
jgi:hypothetical protein